MRALLIDAIAKENISRLKTFADQRRFSLSQMIRRVSGQLPAPGDDPNYTVKLFDGFKVVYTIEQHPEPADWCHHVSISIQAKDQKKPWPHPGAVDEILRCFHLPSHKLAENSWREEGDNWKALNFIFKIRV